MEIVLNDTYLYIPNISPATMAGIRLMVVVFVTRKTLAASITADWTASF